MSKEWGRTLTYDHWLLNILYAAVCRMCLGSGSKLLVWRHKFCGKGKFWLYTAFPKDYSWCHLTNQRYTNANHLITNRLAIQGRIYYFKSILTHFLITLWWLVNYVILFHYNLPCVSSKWSTCDYVSIAGWFSYTWQYIFRFRFRGKRGSKKEKVHKFHFRLGIDFHY